MKYNLQNIILPQTNICTNELLYFRRKGSIDYHFGKNFIKLDNHSCVDFDAYFNSFNLTKWNKYTKFGNLSLLIRIKGHFLISICKKRWINKIVSTDYIYEKEYRTGGSIKLFEIPIELSALNEPTGSISFCLYSKSDNSIFYEASFASNITENDFNNINLGIVICTYNRERFLSKNLETISQLIRNDQFKNKISVFIVDNAKTIKKIDHKNIYLINNINAGGTGGFTRGIIEIFSKKYGNFSHIMLMDDDVVLESESLVRTIKILSLLKKEYCKASICGSMIDLDKKSMQIEKGARWNAGKLLSLKSGLDLSSSEACLYNDLDESADFGAWWYHVFPTSLIVENDLPLPIFIRGDDVEFGLRNKNTLIFWNGISVWHQSFEAKHSSSIYYYVYRNTLIVNSVHKINKFSYFKDDFFKAYLREVFFYRYKNADLMIRAVNDFLKGVDFLSKTDPEKLHKDIQLHGYRMQPIEKLSLPFSYPKYLSDKESNKYSNFFYKLIRLITINGLLMKKSTYSILPFENLRLFQFFKPKQVILFNESQAQGVVVKHSIRKTISCIVKYLITIIKLRIRIRSVSNNFYLEKHELTNFDFWKKYLKLE